MNRPAAWLLGACCLAAGCNTAPEGDAGRPRDGVNGVDVDRAPTGEKQIDLAALERAVKQAILELGDASPSVRDRAIEKCITAGQAAVPWLKAARDKSKDREARGRIDQVLEALGEEGLYISAIDRVLREDFDGAVDELERYRAFGRGRYGRQAEYLYGEVMKLGAHQAKYPARAGGPLNFHKEASVEQLWDYAAQNHNVYLFFRSRGVDSPVFFERARDHYAEAIRKDAGNRRAWTCQAALFAAAGKEAGAKEALDRALALPERSGWDLMDLAVYYTAAGKTDAAIATLREALPRCAEEARKAGSDPDYPRWWASESNDFDALRTDSRFTELVRKP